MNAIAVQHASNHTDVICHASGITTARFACTCSEILQDIKHVELISYNIPINTDTITVNNNCLDFKLGPFITNIDINDGGYGYCT